MFSTLKTLFMVGAYFAAFELGKMNERPRKMWPAAKPGQNPWMVGDWATYQKVCMGVVGVAILLTVMGPGGGFGGGFGGMGMGGGGGYY